MLAYQTPAPLIVFYTCLDRKLKDDLVAIAVRRGETLSALIRTCIEQAEWSMLETKELPVRDQHTYTRLSTRTRDRIFLEAAKRDITASKLVYLGLVAMRDRELAA